MHVIRKFLKQFSRDVSRSKLAGKNVTVIFGKLAFIIAIILCYFCCVDYVTHDYVVCAQRRLRQCRAAGVIRNNILTLSPGHSNHTHQARPLEEDVDNFEAELYSACRRQFRSVRVIYEEIRLNFPQAAAERPFYLMRPRMLGWQRGIQLPPVDNYLAIQRAFEDRPTFALHDTGRMWMNCITAQDGTDAAVWGCAGLPQLLPEIQELDITLRHTVIPQVNDTQVVMVITALCQRYAFSFSWAIFNNFTPAICTEVLRAVRRELLPNIDPRQIRTNVDNTVSRAISTIWENAEVRPSFHHIACTILNGAHHAGVQLNHPEHVKIVKKIVLVALLPARAIRHAVEWITRSMAADIRPVFDGFLNWFHELFFVSQDPEDWSCYDRRELLSNLAMIVGTKLLNVNNRERRPDFWPFYRTTMKIINDSTIDARKLMNGEPNAINNITMTPSVRSSMPSVDIIRLWRMYERGSLTIDRFLQLAAWNCRHYLDDVIFQDDYTRGPRQEPVPRAPAPVQENAYEYAGPVPDEAGILLEIHFDQLQEMLRFGAEDNNEAAENLAEDIPANADDQLQERVLEVGNAEPYDWRCLRCHERRIQLIARPCNCVCTCLDCAIDLRREAAEDGLRCPQCALPANNFERVYMEETGDPAAPYNWSCQICFEHPISHMGQLCHQLKTCGHCVDRIRAQHGDDRTRCPFCNILGRMIHVRLPRINQ